MLVSQSFQHCGKDSKKQLFSNFFFQLSIAKQEAKALDEANSSTGKFAIRKTS
jgi:hypothetical protein